MNSRPYCQALGYLFGWVLICTVTVTVDASPIDRHFDELDELTVASDAGVAHARTSLLTTGMPEGRAAVRLSWRSKPKETGEVGIAIDLPPTDFSDRNLTFHVMLEQGTWAHPVFWQQDHGHFGVKLFDESKQLAATYDWQTWYHVAEPGKWQLKGLPTQTGGTPAYRGGITRGDGDLTRITKLVLYAQSGRPGEAASIVFDYLREETDPFLSRYPRIADYLRTRRHWREKGNYSAQILNWPTNGGTGKTQPLEESSGPAEIIQLKTNRTQLYATTDQWWKQNFVDRMTPGTRRQGQLALLVEDGNNDHQIVRLNSSSAKLQQRQNGVSVEAVSHAPGIVLSNKLEPVKDGLIWRIRASNTKPDQTQKLRFTWRVTWRPDGEFALYDGYEVIWNPQRWSRSEITHTFPVAMVHDAQRGIGIGLDAHLNLSHFSTTLKRNDDGAIVLDYSIRLALAPKQTDEVAITFDCLPGAEGYREAIQRCYEMHPSLFVPTPGMDERFYLGSSGPPSGLAWASLRSHQPLDEIALEIFRRFRQGAWWRFANYKHLGDWYGREENWDLPVHRVLGVESDWPAFYGRLMTDDRLFKQYVDKPMRLTENVNLGRVINTKAPFNRNTEDFHKHRREQWATGEKYGLATTGYVRDQATALLGLLRYPNEIVRDPADRVGWLGNSESSVRLINWYGQWGRNYLDDMTRLVREGASAGGYVLDGFGHDGFLGPWRYRGPLLSDIPGKAYDDKGAYVVSGGPQAAFFDRIRSVTRPDGTRPAMNGHASETYHIAFHQDAALYETGIFRQHSPKKRWMTSLMTGQKPTRTHGHHVYDRTGDLFDANVATQQAIQDFYCRKVDYGLLWNLREGTVPPLEYILGLPKVQYFLPALVEANRLGMQAAPGFRVDHDEVLRSRFGRGIGTLLTFGNLHQERLPFNAIIDNVRHGTWSYIPTRFDGRSIDCRINDGLTHFKDTALPLSGCVYRLTLGITPHTSVEQARVSEHWTDFGSQLDATLHVSDLIPIQFVARIPRDHIPEAVTINGEPVAFMEDDGKLFFKTHRAVSTYEISVNYRSTVFSESKRVILDFPYVADLEKPATIVLTDSASYLDRRAARRLRAFFRFWYRESMSESHDVVMPIVTPTEIGDAQRLIVVGKLPKPFLSNVATDTAKNSDRIRCIERDGSAIVWIDGKDDRARDQLAKKLCDLLELKYGFVGVMPHGRFVKSRNPATFNARRKAGLLDEPLRHQESDWALPEVPGIKRLGDR